MLEMLKFIPALVTAVMALTKAFEVPGFGKEKKDAVLKMLGMIIDTIKSYCATLPLDKVQIIDLAGKAIDFIVGFFNAVGIFKKGGTDCPPGEICPPPIQKKVG